jgi:hypothetical protein
MGLFSSYTNINGGSCLRFGSGVYSHPNCACLAAALDVCKCRFIAKIVLSTHLARPIDLNTSLSYSF